MKSSNATKIKKNKLILFFYYFKSFVLLLIILIRNPKSNVYLYQWEGVGDLSIALSYVPVHAMINRKSMFFCLYKKHKRYVSFFNFINQNVKFYDFQTLDNMCVLSLRFFKNNKKIVVLNPNNYVDLGIYNYEDVSKYGWGEFTRDYILKVPANYYDNIYYPKETDDAKDLKILKKSIFINAFSNSAPSLSSVFLENLSTLLEKKGYTLYFNEQRKEKRHIFLSLNDILKNAHKFSYIISVRSGLLDLLSGKNKNIIAINTTNEDNYSSRYNMAYWRNNGFSFLFEDNDDAIRLINERIK